MELFFKNAHKSPYYSVNKAWKEISALLRFCINPTNIWNIKDLECLLAAP